MKKCSKCGESFQRTPEFFHRNKKTKDGLMERCKRCVSDIHLKRRVERGQKPPEIAVDLPGEEWRGVVGYDKWYSISNIGRIKRISPGRGTAVGRLENPIITDSGYFRVPLSCNGARSNKQVHHLVMEAFIGPRPRGLVCNHKDGDKLNNRVDNLEYVTSSENTKHAYRIGLMKRRYGEDAPNSRLTEVKVREIKILLSQHELTQREISEKYNTTQTTISDILHKKRWEDVE